jgi:hypothetical protein
LTFFILLTSFLQGIVTYPSARVVHFLPNIATALAAVIAFLAAVFLPGVTIAFLAGGAISTFSL